jgi:hypothetical protein
MNSKGHATQGMLPLLQTADKVLKMESEEIEKKKKKCRAV